MPRKCTIDFNNRIIYFQEQIFCMILRHICSQNMWIYFLWKRQKKASIEDLMESLSQNFMHEATWKLEFYGKVVFVHHALKLFWNAYSFAAIAFRLLLIFDYFSFFAKLSKPIEVLVFKCSASGRPTWYSRHQFFKWQDCTVDRMNKFSCAINNWTTL